MSALKRAAKGIIADLIGAPVEEVNLAFAGYKNGTFRGQLYDFDILVLITLFEALMPMIMQLIEQCETKNRNRIIRRIRRPSRRQRRLFRGRCEVALAYLEWDSRDVADVALEYSRYQSKTSISKVIDECRGAK